MRVVRPTKNKLTRGYITGHKGYDFAGLNLPDEVFCGMDGEVISRVDLYTTNWINTGTLTTKDYGNYIKVRHGDGTYELHAHLSKGSSLVVGTRVKAGQIIARIGNTGNSTGKHLHSEFRNSANTSLPAEFIELPITPPNMNDQKKAVQFDQTLNFLKDKGYITDNDSNHYLDWQFFTLMQKLYGDLESNRGRAGKWDGLCIKAGLTGDSNAVTVDELYNKLKSGIDKKEFVDKIIAYLRTL